MSLHETDPSTELRMTEAKRAVLDYAETVADGRTSGTLSAEALDRLATATRAYQRLRHEYLSMV